MTMQNDQICKDMYSNQVTVSCPTDLLEDALGKIICLLEQCETGDRATFYKAYCAAMTDDNFWKVEKEAIEKVS